jgi:aminopeptidase-like protein
MNTCLQTDSIDQPEIAMYQLIVDLYPICRSITGDGVRQTLRYLQQFIKLQLSEIPTGTPVFDWTIPKEWSIQDAYIKNFQGEKIVDFQSSNLHVLNYSCPIHQTVSLSELKAHLFSLPDRPNWIPYRTSYYQENWGFCLTHNQLESLQEGDYEVCIDSTLADGHLTYGECFLPGDTHEEVLFSCHCCHPSLCNDNLSGIAVATFLARYLHDRPRRYSYRFLFIPGTIGSIAWLSQNHDRVFQIKHGLAIAGVGDAGHLHYKKSRQGNAEIDRVVAYVLQQSQQPYTLNDFSPYGYDERQFCSPGFNVPFGSLTRSPFDTYPEYHTSADNLDFVSPAALADSLSTYQAIVDVLEHNQTYRSTNPYCEPQLGKRGLYGTFGGKKTTKDEEMALLWVLNLSDSTHSLLDITERSHLPFTTIHQAAQKLFDSGLLETLIASTHLVDGCN